MARRNPVWAVGGHLKKIKWGRSGHVATTEPRGAGQCRYCAMRSLAGRRGLCEVCRVRILRTVRATSPPSGPPPRPSASHPCAVRCVCARVSPTASISARVRSWRRRRVLSCGRLSQPPGTYHTHGPENSCCCALVCADQSVRQLRQTGRSLRSVSRGPLGA